MYIELSVHPLSLSLVVYSWNVYILSQEVMENHFLDKIWNSYLIIHMWILTQDPNFLAAHKRNYEISTKNLPTFLPTSLKLVAEEDSLLISSFN